MAKQSIDKATPRPWRASTFAIYSETESVAHTGGCGRSNEQRVANAILIVEAVNSYDQLRAENAALRKAYEAALRRFDNHRTTMKDGL